MSIVSSLPADFRSITPAGFASRHHYFLPRPVLRRVFRGKFVAGLSPPFQHRQLRFPGRPEPLARPKAFAAWLRPLHRQNWVVYLKRPFGGPEYVLQYLGRYTHRVAISNHRLVSFSDGQVTFRWRDSAHQNEQKLLTLSLDEFLRRFLLHILPKGFVRIRNFGFLANRNRVTLLPLCFQLLGPVAPLQTEADTSRVPPPQPALALSPMWRSHDGHRETHRCPTATPLATLSLRSRRMKLPFQALSLGAHHRQQAVCALLASEQVIRSQPRPKIQFPPRASSTKTILPLLFPTPVAVPGALSHSPQNH